MNETIVGTPTRYSGFPGTDPGNADEPFTATFGRLAIRADSQEELNEFVAWLSNLAGKPVDQLRERDILKYVKVSLLSNSVTTAGPNGSIKSFSVKQALTDSITDFTDKEFFGETIPQFTAGTGAFIGAPLDLPPGTGMNASTAGFAATAQMLYAGNYSQEPDTQLSQAELDQLDPNVLALLKDMFGSETPLSLNH